MATVLPFRTAKNAFNEYVDAEKKFDELLNTYTSTTIFTRVKNIHSEASKQTLRTAIALETNAEKHSQPQVQAAITALNLDEKQQEVLDAYRARKKAETKFREAAPAAGILNSRLVEGYLQIAHKQIHAGEPASVYTVDHRGVNGQPESLGAYLDAQIARETAKPAPAAAPAPAPVTTPAAVAAKPATPAASTAPAPAKPLAAKNEYEVKKDDTLFTIVKKLQKEGKLDLPKEGDEKSNILAMTLIIARVNGIEDADRLLVKPLKLPNAQQIATGMANLKAGIMDDGIIGYTKEMKNHKVSELVGDINPSAPAKAPKAQAAAK